MAFIQIMNGYKVWTGSAQRELNECLNKDL